MSTTAPSRPPSSASRPPSISSGTFGQMRSLTRRIRAMLSTEPAHGHAVGVTSCSRREGVSVVARNLAICAAELNGGQVLLVDANPRYASVASQFGIKQAAGLSDCLAGERAVQECLAGTSHSNLRVLPAGSSVIRSARQSDERATALFDNLRGDFELIVVDLPPVDAMDEMILASRSVDGLLLVIESEHIRRQVAQSVVRQLEQIDTRLLGVVLNKRKNHIPEWLYRRL